MTTKAKMFCERVASSESVLTFHQRQLWQDWTTEQSYPSFFIHSFLYTERCVTCCISIFKVNGYSCKILQPVLQRRQPLWFLSENGLPCKKRICYFQEQILSCMRRHLLSREAEYFWQTASLASVAIPFNKHVKYKSTLLFITFYLIYFSKHNFGL